jgi:predicted sugar kinase
MPDVNIVHIKESHTGIGSACRLALIVGKQAREAAKMEAYQWFLLGMMVAWTPGLLTLALMLRKDHIR